MTQTEANKRLREVGVTNATGESLALAYAELIRTAHGGATKKYFEHLRQAKSDAAIFTEAKALLIDRAQAYDVLLGLRAIPVSTLLI